MTTEYVIKRKVVRLGRPLGSLVVSIPKVWAEAHGIVAGQEVLVAFDDYGYLKIMPSPKLSGTPLKGSAELSGKAGRRPSDNSLSECQHEH